MLAAVLVSWPAFAAPLELAPDGEFYENYGAATKISGAPIVGVMALGSPRPGVPLTATIPASWGGMAICARLVSSDGRYEARGQYRVPVGWGGGVAELDYPTDITNKIAQLTADEIAALISRGDCDHRTRPLALAEWKADPGVAATLLVNSFRSEETFLVFPSGADVSCEPIASAQRTAFDMSCSIPDELAAGAASLEIEINRVRAGSIAPPTVVTVDLR